MLRRLSMSLFRDFSVVNRQRLASTGVIKSPLSYDKIYPNSNQDYCSSPKFDASKYVSTEHGEPEPFTGFIPPEEIQFTYLRSGGAGGQNVNKVATKVEVRFHVESATWIPGWIKPKFLLQEKNRVNKAGYFVISSERTRKQLLNQADCMEKIRAAVRRAAVVNTIGEEDIEILKEREENAKKIALKEKRTKSLKKQRRQAPTVQTT